MVDLFLIIGNLKSHGLNLYLQFGILILHHLVLLKLILDLVLLLYKLVLEWLFLLKVFFVILLFQFNLL